MRFFTVALLFLFMGSYTLTAQNVQSVSISSEFMIVLDAVPKAGTTLQFDINQFNFKNEVQARRVIAGFGTKGVKVNFADKTASITLSERLITRVDSDVNKINKFLVRFSKEVQARRAATTIN